MRRRQSNLKIFLYHPNEISFPPSRHETKLQRASCVAFIMVQNSFPKYRVAAEQAIIIVLLVNDWECQEMAETFVNQTFNAEQSSVGARVGNLVVDTNLLSGLTGVTVNGTVDLPNSPVTLDLNVAGAVQTGLPATYVGFTQASPTAEPIYYFDVTPAGLQAPVTVSVSAGTVPALNVLTPINTTPTTSAPDSPSIVCFVTGTRIRTERGEVAVEDLQIGDLAVTASGAQLPIRWIGHRLVEAADHADPQDVWPVRIAAGALGENKPERDLLVSPGHAVCLDILGEVLIPAWALVNGTTITQEQVEEVTYWHVELDRHDILIANGQPAESYLDMGNRTFFSENSVVDLSVQADADPASRTHTDFCRPFHDSGAVVDAVRAQLRRRAKVLGWSLEQADTWAGVRLEVDGQFVAPKVRGLSACFEVPAGAQDVCLVSPTSVPRHVTDNPDNRALGLSLTGLRLDDGLNDTKQVALDDELLDEGFHAMAPGHRWTAGRARLPAALFAGLEGTAFLRVDLGAPALPRWATSESTVETRELQPAGLRLVKAA
ncbi:Hint domain-containing protein [Methylorubrum extorquens]|uniref:Hint domain-containing protein n=1 Tax=Methylorubrum extorquens TaxID=408 RepID=UPI003F609C90